MKIRPARFLVLLCSVSCSFLACAGADTHTAVTLSTADVQAAINASSDGDTVQLPSGTGIWSGAIRMNNKGITVRGAGMDQTVIINNLGPAFPSFPLYIYGGTGKSFRICHLTFSGYDGVNYSSASFFIDIRGSWQNFRIDHCKFIGHQNAAIDISYTDPTGLIDHCTFYNSIRWMGHPTGSITGVMYVGSGNSFGSPLSLGTSNAVCVEDNYFFCSTTSVAQCNNIPAVAGGNGMRTIIRYNLFEHEENELKPVGGAGTTRGCISNEVYNNTYRNLLANNLVQNIDFDGGAGVVFNNTIAGGYARPQTAVSDIRSCSSVGVWGKCDGTSPYDGNLPWNDDWANYTGAHTGSDGASVLTCSGKTWIPTQLAGLAVWNITDNSRGLITANTANTITATLASGARNNWNAGDTFKVTNGYPCLDQIGRGPTSELVNGTTVQKSEPVYLWNNTINGSPGVMQVYTCMVATTHIHVDRDFYNNTQRPGYVPFTYPHPLVLEDIVDTSSPSAPSVVYDSTGTDISFTFSTTTLAANWAPGTDAESGIPGYRYAISSVSAGGTEFVGWTVNGGQSVIRAGLVLSAGTTYYFTVKSVNGAGLISETAANSNGQYVAPDNTLPSAPATVRDGPTAGADISVTTSTVELSANWTAGVDAESGISGYKYAIGTTAGGTNTAGWTMLSNIQTVMRSGLSLAAGTTYYFTVKSVNGAGFESFGATNSNGVLVVSTADATAPVMSGVRDGTGADISYTMASDRLSANWDSGIDAESGISGYQYAIGTSAGGTQTLAWTTLAGNFLAVTKTSLALVTGTTYYFSVRAINGNNMTGTAVNTNGQYAVSIDTGDKTPPSNITAVRDGAAADISFTASLTSLAANWDASSDPESGIARYWYAIGTTPGGAEAQTWTDNGQMTAISLSNFNLTPNLTYYVSVKAENNLGLQSSTTTSDGQAVYPPDTSSPSVSGIAVQNITAGGATIIWTTDEEATTLVEYGRTTGYGKQTIEDTSLMLSHSAALTGLLASSVYHYRVISRDAVGNETTGADGTFTTLPAAGQSGGIVSAYPNPCRAIGAGNPVKFSAGGAAVSEVGIYSVSGRLVRKITHVPADTQVTWDGTNADGEKTGRGIYIYRITSTAGDSITGKLALTK